MAIKLIPKRKIVPTEDVTELVNIRQIINHIIQGGFSGTLDDIPDGITYGRVLQTWLTSGAIRASTLTQAGAVEIATSAETTTGTDATRAVSPDGLAGSIFGEKGLYVHVLTYLTGLTTGDDKTRVTIPDAIDGMNLVDADAAVYTKSSSGLVTISIERSTDHSAWSDMLSTDITIDANEWSSYTALTPPVINAAVDDVSSGDWIRINVDGAGTGTTGLDVLLSFQLP